MLLFQANLEWSTPNNLAVLVPDGDGKVKVIISTREEQFVGETADCPVSGAL